MNLLREVTYSFIYIYCLPALDQEGEHEREYGAVGRRTEVLRMVSVHGEMFSQSLPV